LRDNASFQQLVSGQGRQCDRGTTSNSGLIILCVVRVCRDFGRGCAWQGGVGVKVRAVSARRRDHQRDTTGLVNFIFRRLAGRGALQTSAIRSALQGGCAGSAWRALRLWTLLSGALPVPNVSDGHHDCSRSLGGVSWRRSRVGRLRGVRCAGYARRSRARRRVIGPPFF
jgi:hypothetical protein